MTEVHVMANITAKAGCDLEAISDAISKLANGSRVEDGCLRYDVFLSVEDAGEWLIREVWKSPEALARHKSGRSVEEFKAATSARVTIEVHAIDMP